MMSLPVLPVPLTDFIPYLNRSDSVREALQPYIEYEQALRKLYAQQPEHALLANPLVNAVPIYTGHESMLQARARNLPSETPQEKESYLMPLSNYERKATGEPAIASSLKEFTRNFNLFSESSLVDLNWSNVVVAGSAAVTPLLPVKSPHDSSKRALRNYYHEQLAPASDVDVFIYGLDEAQAIEKIKQIETRIRDSILQETTTVRTKNTITIASQYPTRHVQIVLRLYKSISEILTGFDVDCSCVAFDGTQVYATPRAIAAFVTQVNTIDLTRRSPSYENRLSKYSHRGFEAFWPDLDRSRVDPSIFERAFSRVLGLARLLVLEKLPHPQDRVEYQDKRRKERGRPPKVQHVLTLAGNLKDQQPDDVAEWVEEDEVSNYHTFTIPYGPRYHAKRIEKLLFTKDLLLNAEWNRPKDRKTNLHRHPAFFGQVHDVIEDCCGFCPEPLDDEDKDIAESEAKHYIRGAIRFMKDDPGRQEIGSFNPITDDDWTEMAYVGNTTRLCQAIVDEDYDHVEDWLRQDGVDVNRRDHTGRTPLQLAAKCSSVEVAKCLIDHGARIVARTAEGFTALHFAAQRGHIGIVTALLEKSEANQAEEDEREERKTRRKSVPAQATASSAEELGDKAVDFENDVEMVDDEESLGSKDTDDITQGSYLRVKIPKDQPEDPESDPEDLDIYNIDVLAWDHAVSPLHLAILYGHVDVVRLLIDQFAADVLLPAKVKTLYVTNPDVAIMTLVMAAQHSAPEMVRELLSHGASSSQADMAEKTVLYYFASENCHPALDLLMEYDRPAAENAINHVIMDDYQYHQTVTSPLIATIQNGNSAMAVKLLELGARPDIDFDTYLSAYSRRSGNHPKLNDQIRGMYQRSLNPPIILAALEDMPDVVQKLIEKGANINSLSKEANSLLNDNSGRAWYGDKRTPFGTLLDIVRSRQQTLRNAMDAELKSSSVPPPEALPSDEEMLKGLDASSYRYWAAKNDLAAAKVIHQRMSSLYESQLSKANEDGDTTSSKVAALKDTLARFKDLETRLVRLKAKSVEDLNPKVKPHLEPLHELIRANKALYNPFKPLTRFYIPRSYEPLGDGYLELFEAAWRGDIKRIREMTLAPWNNIETNVPSEKQRPLIIAACDSAGFTPFAIAMTRGNYDVARAIVEIATVQYQPKDDGMTYRYTLEVPEYQDGLVSELDDDDDDRVPVFSHLVTDQITIQDISILANTGHSQTSPLQMIESRCETWRLFHTLSIAKALDLRIPEFSDEIIQLACPEKHCSTAHISRLLDHTKQSGLYANPKRESRDSLVAYAISRNDMTMFSFLVQTSTQLLRSQSMAERTQEDFKISECDFAHAARLGRVEILSEMLRTAGAQLPLQEIAKRSGLEIKERSKYYQGLTVYGKKRRDWAEQSRGLRGLRRIEDETPPLIIAALQNNTDATEFFFGETPLRRYEEYIAEHKDIPAVETIAQSEGGASNLLDTWLRSRRELAIHAAAMSRPHEQEKNLQLQFLLKQLPDCIDSRTRKGRTPLHLAYKYGRYAAAKYLLENGADPLLCDKGGENVLHHYLSITPDERLDKVLVAFLNLTSADITCKLLLKRSAHCNNAYTPLSVLLHSHSGNTGVRVAAMTAMLAFTGGKDLEIMDAKGDYPLHYAVRQSMTQEARLFIEHAPQTLHFENAVGMTALDIANGAVLKARITPPRSPRVFWYGDLSGQLERLQKSVDQQRIPWPDQCGVNEMLSTLHELAEKYPGQRKLVCLDDANEVAKRLALTVERRGRIEQAHRDEGDDMDKWHWQALTYKNWDLKRLQSKAQ